MNGTPAPPPPCPHHRFVYEDNGFDLLVIGSTGHSEFYEALLDGRADRIVPLAHCPLLVVK